jgi:hypothetical protein
MYDKNNTNDIASPTYHPSFERRIEELKQLYSRGYDNTPEVYLAKDLYHDLETCRVIAESILGSVSGAEVLAIFNAMQQRLHQ